MCDLQRLRSACAYTQSDQSLCWLLEYSKTVKLLTKHHLEFLCLKGGSTGSPESMAPDKAAYCVFTQFLGPENAIKLISLRTKMQ